MERVSLQLQARLKFGAKPSIAFGHAKDRFVRGSNTIELTGSRFGKHSRGTFFEELQHAIDDAVGVNPSRFPKPGTLENAQFHLEVFERLIANPIYKLNPIEKLNLIRKTKELIASLGG